MSSSLFRGGAIRDSPARETSSSATGRQSGGNGRGDRVAAKAKNELFS